MSVEIKFCGLTRPEDAVHASDLGAAYGGVIFAGGPRKLTVERAKDVFGAVGDRIRRVGVFGAQTIDEIEKVVVALALDVVQLHAEPPEGLASEIRLRTGAKVWPVIRLAGAEVPDSYASAMMDGDAVVIDAKVEGKLGGTGVALPWAKLAPELEIFRARPLVLAGGLNPENVGDAIRALSPTIVDVSSGVESAPGVKDHARMKAFRDAVRRASPV